MVQEINDEKTSPAITKGWTILAMLSLSPIFFLSIYLGHVKQGLGAWACAGVVTIAVKTFWTLRHRAWFWPVVLFAILIQVPFVLLVPWDNRNLSFISLLPAGVLDFAIVYGSFKLAEKLMMKD